MQQASHTELQRSQGDYVDSCFPQSSDDADPPSLLDLNIHATPSLGNYWPGEGGVYVGQIKQADDATSFYLVADISFSHDLMPWHHLYLDIQGANDYSNGWENTSAMANYGCPIALLARSVTIDGKSDWYLPSQAEAHLLAANARKELKFIAFWTSTQHSDTLSWCQDSRTGSQFTCDKSRPLSTVLIRKFSY